MSQSVSHLAYRKGVSHYLVRNNNRGLSDPEIVKIDLWHDRAMNTTTQTSALPDDDDEGPATPQDTRKELLQFTARHYTQIRHVFVQLPDRDKPRPSMVGHMVHERKHRALILYLLLLTIWPWLKERRDPFEAAIWLRALDSSDVPDSPSGTTWSSSTLSRAWTDLGDMGLVTTKRESRLVRVTPRREDGGDDYTTPGGRKDRWNVYFTLPEEFWLEGWFAKLSLPALAMLLTIAKETSNQPETRLPYESAPEWYGISPKSAQKGLKELDEHNLLHIRIETKKSALSPTGKTVRFWYSLTGEFGYTARVARQAAAAKAANKKKSAKKAPKIS